MMRGADATDHRVREALHQPKHQGTTPDHLEFLHGAGAPVSLPRQIAIWARQTLFN